MTRRKVLSVLVARVAILGRFTQRLTEVTNAYEIVLVTHTGRAGVIVL